MHKAAIWIFPLTMIITRLLDIMYALFKREREKERERERELKLLDMQ